MVDGLLEELSKLERTVHQPDVLSNRDSLTKLLHDSFKEFGRSGRCWNKAEMLRELPERGVTRALWSQDYCLEAHTQSIALLTYKSASVDENGQLYRHSLRSSLWQRSDSGWRLLFHQGTATSAFTKS